MLVQSNQNRCFIHRALNSITKCLVFCSLFILLHSIPLSTLAAEEDIYRILVLHPEWFEQDWHRKFDQMFADAIAAEEGSRVEVSFQNLGLDKIISPDTRQIYVENFETIVTEQGVDMLVALLPAAIEFVLEVDSLADMPKVLVLPGRDFDSSQLSAETVRVVESNSNEAITKTIELARTLHPDANTIEVFSGIGQTDIAYRERTRALSESHFKSLSFHFHSGLPLSEISEYTSALTEESIVILLPHAVFDAGEVVYSTTFMPLISDASAVPVYGIADSWLGLGLTGGYFFTVDQHARAASSVALSLMRNATIDQGELAISGDYIFDYQQLGRWNISPDTLNDSYIIYNRPRTMLDDYAGFIYTIGLLILLLTIAIALQFIMLKRSEMAKLQLQKSERQARESEVRFQLLTRNSLDVIWSWDGDRKKTTYCSASIEQLTGYTPEEFLSLPITEAMTSQSKEVALNHVLSIEFGAQVFEIELIRKNGSTVWCEIAAQPIGGAGDHQNNWIGVTRDISKRKEAEKERLTLENQVRQSQKFESLGTLAGGIAHDFNNMLGVIMGLTELLKLKMSDNPEALAISDKLVATTDKAKAMVGQILTFSRQSAGKKKIANLYDLVSDTIQIMRTGMPKSVKLDYKSSDETINVRCDENQLSQVFINTLTNAFEAIDEQEGMITVGIEELEFDQQMKYLHGELPPGRYAKVRIEDNGDGLRAEEIEKMFDPFYTSKDLGNGMGLAIVRGVVISHGGAIDIQSESGLGTTVSIYIPTTILEPMTDEAAEAIEYDGDKSTILLIDDQKDLLETMSLMLKELGHQCISVSSPRQALDLIADKTVVIDLVITDYSMPGISGIEVREFSARHRPELPVILATGYSDRVSKDVVEEESMNYVLNKPFGFGELKSMLSKTL